MSKSNPQKSYVQEGHYDRFLANCYGINPSTGNPLDPSKQSVSSRKFCGSLNLLESSSRMNDCADFLEHSFLPTLNNSDSSKTNVKNVVKVVDKTIIPFMTAASSVRQSAARIVSHFSRSLCACQIRSRQEEPTCS